VPLEHPELVVDDALVDEDDEPPLPLDDPDEDDADATDDDDEEEEPAGCPPEPLELADELPLDPEPHATAADIATTCAETIARPLIVSGYHRRLVSVRFG
jgi:hypothetical protein